MASLFPDELISAGGQRVKTATALGGKVVGIYFSAHWCPPCRQFTPRLCEWFKNFKSNSANKDKFELVFVSSDHDEESFKEYHGSMNFHALDYADRAKKDQLSGKFGVQGIPSLVIVNAAGEIITKNGRKVVANDPNGEQFPWAPKTPKEMLNTALIDNKGNTFGLERLDGKYLGLYFSAHWCPPCRQFTPKLIEVYKTLTAAGKPFELVFCSSDESQAAFDEYFATMPFLALPYSNRMLKDELSERFEVEGIPTLILLDPEGRLVNEDGRGAIGADPTGAAFPWVPSRINELTDAVGSILNKAACLIAFTDGSDADADRVKGILEKVADDPAAADIKFFYTKQSDFIDAVMDFASIKDNQKLVLLDIPAQSKFVAESSALTQENISAFVRAYTAGSLSPQQIR